MEELNLAIDTLRPNKAGGPDELIIELFKDLDQDNRQNILRLHNENYETSTIPVQTALDSRIVDVQYGYRQGRSTAEPIFIARRIQEITERHGLELLFLALDYSKAFDSIPHDRLVESLHRLGAPRDMIRLVELLYASPNFRIKIPEGISEEYEQQISIRQGCPLSPYLYIIATSCLMTDVLKDWDNEPDNALPPGANHPIFFCLPTTPY